MGTIIVGILILFIGYAIKNFWWIVICAVAVLVMTRVLENKELHGVVKAELINEVAVTKEKPVNTGFSVGYSYRSYYRYKQVVDHYECSFKVWYEDGRTGTIKCRKYSAMYRKLNSRRA